MDILARWLLRRFARGHGWHVEVSGADGRKAFDEQERLRRKKAWALLRKGRISEGYRTGVFGKTQTGAWHTELTVTGTWRGRPFTATQLKRHELTSGETTHRRVRRRSSLTMGDRSVELGTRLRGGRLLAALDQLSGQDVAGAP